MEQVNLPARENTHCIVHNRPSAPIEIPSRCRPIMPATSSPFGRPMSPELLFEMSPIISEFPSPPTYNFGFRASQESEPFLYHFPTFPKSGRPPGFRTRGPTLSTLHSSSATPQSPSIFSFSNMTDRRLPLCRLEDNDILPTPLTSSSKGDIKNKITGFSPPMSIPSLISRPNRSPSRAWKRRVLSPPPRSSSYSSSPWILPGKSDLIEEDTTYPEVDPSTFDFEQHLMRRIENQNHTRFRKTSLSSVHR